MAPVPDDRIELRQPTDDEATLRAFVKPAMTAFAQEYSDEMFAIDRQVWEVDRMIGAVEGERWVGSAGIESLHLTVPGGQVRAAGITAVGVAPSHRRRGILTRMMHWMLDQAADRGEPVAVLHASEGAIYPHFGFGMATLQGSFEFDARHLRFLRPAEPLGRVRLVDADEGMQLIPPIFDQVRAGRPGEVSRSPAKWRHIMLADDPFRRSELGPKSNVVLEVGGEPRGFATYRVKQDWDERGPKYVLTVMEVTALDIAAERALWEWLAGVDLVTRIRAWRTAVPMQLTLQLEDIRRIGTTIGSGIYLRILDLISTLEARSYVGSGSLTLELTDAFIPANAGRWRLDVRDGVATVASTTDAPDLVLDIADLATVYLGAFSFHDLARAGRLTECRGDAITDADRSFASNLPAWCSTPF
jgi:predicted acetyltransferase